MNDPRKVGKFEFVFRVSVQLCSAVSIVVESIEIVLSSLTADLNFLVKILISKERKYVNLKSKSMIEVKIAEI